MDTKNKLLNRTRNKNTGTENAAIIFLKNYCVKPIFSKGSK